MDNENIYEFLSPKICSLFFPLLTFQVFDLLPSTNWSTFLVKMLRQR